MLLFLKFQVSGHKLSDQGVEAYHSIGTYLGWAMAVIYMGGRLPQICLNVSYIFLMFRLEILLIKILVSLSHNLHCEELGKVCYRNQ